VAAGLRGLPVTEALSACQFMPRSAARDLAKVIRSAQANAEHNFNLSREDLVLKELLVESGPMLKRGQPRAMGRLFSVFKRTSHITAIVEDRPGRIRRRPARPRPDAAQARAQAPAAAPAQRTTPASAKPEPGAGEAEATGPAEAYPREEEKAPQSRPTAARKTSPRKKEKKEG
jgi:large subunit ribosomal protein L22